MEPHRARKPPSDLEGPPRTGSGLESLTDPSKLVQQIAKLFRLNAPGAGSVYKGFNTEGLAAKPIMPAKLDLPGGVFYKLIAPLLKEGGLPARGQFAWEDSPLEALGDLSPIDTTGRQGGRTLEI